MQFKNVNIHKLVGYVLAESPETRGDDHELLLKCWEKLGLKLDAEQVKAFKRVPHLERFTRYRRKYQEAGKYLPNAQIMEERRKREASTRQEMIDF